MTYSKPLLALSAALLLFGPVQTIHAAGGWLGVHPEHPRGVQVGDVIKDSPADKSGLTRGDLILRLNGRDLTSISQFSMEIYRADPGSEVTLTILRNGETKEIKTKLDNVAGHNYALPNTGSAQSQPANRLPAIGPVGPGHTHDFQTRLKSAWSMLEAYERIAEEKKLGEKGKQISTDIRAMLTQAQQFLDKYQVNEGVPLMERAYAKAQNALIQVRKGETLIQSLSFPTPEAEYIYELGRNNVFQMFLEQALNSQGISPESTPQIEEARALRNKAEGNAGKKEFKAGIEQLEQSTNLLTELLRKAGLDIP
ncbi:MAG: PDZ domain-containing protein [Magnetococcales bacterium]|nr:PDZ domain-containing protein [Magnetococcales bacterium]